MYWYIGHQKEIELHDLKEPVQLTEASFDLVVFRVDTVAERFYPPAQQPIRKCYGFELPSGGFGDQIMDSNEE